MIMYGSGERKATREVVTKAASGCLRCAEMGSRERERGREGDRQR
jgi:hypothetical protein